MSDPNSTGIYENLPDNSHANRVNNAPVKQESDGRRAEKIVRGRVKTKKNTGRGLLELFISEDAPNVGEYILMDVLAPAIKKAFYDIIVNSLDITLWGGRGNGGKRSTADKVSFRDYNGISRKDDRNYDRSRSSSRYNYEDIILETRGEAEAVLQRMDEIMETYEIVRVADLYDLVGVTGEHTDNKYGWTDIRNAKVERVRDGYRIVMPRALPINRR
jgi:hypothetical protein